MPSMTASPLRDSLPRRVGIEVNTNGHSAPHTNGHATTTAADPEDPNFASQKPWLVQKFGGTSIGKFIENITGTIVQSYLPTNRVVVVCSARSSESKSLGTTNRLLRAAKSAMSPGSIEYIEVVQEIRLDHLDVAKKHISNPEILKRVMEEVNQDCDRLKAFLEAAQIIEEISPRSNDIIMAVGEKLSCRIVAGLLEDRGVETQFVNLENVIETKFEVEFLDQNFYDYLSRAFACAISNCGHRVPVVTGFFGPVPGSLLTSIGRGYTDLAAALIAVGLDAEELQVWKEVDGIFTADPRKVKSARLLNIITPEEASELTYYGSEVIHPFTMEQVIRAQIPIRIKNVMNPQGEGTIIFPDQSSSTSTPNGRNTPPPSYKVLLENGYLLDMSRRHPTAVTIKDNVWVLNIHSNRKSVSHGFFAQIFSTLDRFGIAVDLISTSEVHISMAFGAVTSEIEKKCIESLRSIGTVDVTKNMAILSLVGKQMKNMVGISGRMFTTLAKAGINIEMISQGASEINISCVILERQALDALNVIHEELLSKVGKYEEAEDDS
ncbi:Aspartokinase [Lobosporangium transversale]|uniref:Aspartokinase n=1 Tax=Lobosporangium transversale TaxID=64571 RepID=A0A1Y2GZK0_9FUNG|nr:Aspartate/glutamate/uridylate kinase [Lobosporangium transversale]KAF9916214.1 Aspartokinase [Lobosporangium transversale]ORZ27738.1 Aspartate/glutamate/uridylate kinase [Lobosporangium transversale]|eukprot:XP_021885441.1 Aspartate/glutamate/uridylate kinase [Lobosporangium transversale]